MDEQRRREFVHADRATEKTRVYLDLKYWIYCRDARENQDCIPAHRALYNLLRRLVTEGIVICPLSEVVLTEALKQSNPGRRAVMAEVVDELSLGFCLKPLTDRVRGELLRFLYRTQLPQLPLEEGSRLVWTRPAFVLGWLLPEGDGISNSHRDAFTEHLWQMSTKEVLSYLFGEDVDLSEIRPAHQSLARQINVQNEANANPALGWKGLYESEIRGVFSAFSDIVWDSAVYFQSKHPDVLPSPSVSTHDLRERMAASFATGFIARQLWQELPTIHILATLYARIRHDRQRLIKSNDFEDFGHAAAALPYCNAFLTDNSLAALLNTGSPSLASQFGVQAIANPDSAIAWLQTLSTP